MMHVCRWRWWWWYALRISLPNHIFSFLPSQTGLQLGLFTPSFCSSHLHFFLLFIFLKYPSSHSHLHHPPLHATSPTPVWILYFLLSKKRNFISIGASTKCMKSKNLIFFYYFFLKEFSFWCLLFFPFPLFIMLFISWKLVGYVFMWHLSALCSHVLYVNWEVCVKFWFLIIVFFVLASSEVCGLVLEISFGSEYCNRAQWLWVTLFK